MAGVLVIVTGVFIFLLCALVFAPSGARAPHAEDGVCLAVDPIDES